MDIKGKIDEIVKKVKSDKTVQEGFQKDPVKTVEGLIGVDLPEDQIKQVVEGVKAKINLDSIGSKLGGLGGLLG